jgi:FMN-dependent NADH-azoreductase
MNILHIDCSPRPDSHSRRLSAAVVERLLKFDGCASITRRDLGLKPIPHISADYAAMLSVPVALPRGASEEATRLSEMLIREIEAADVLVIGTPMNNFTVPSVLKAWIEQIVRLGRTIVPSPTGKVGALRDRPVFVGVASGGVFSGDRASQPDFLTSYLSAALGCIGLKSLHFLMLQATSALSQEQSATIGSILAGKIDASMIATRGPPLQ